MGFTVEGLPAAFKPGSAASSHIGVNGDVADVRERALWKTTMKKAMTGAMTALLLASTAAPALAQHRGFPDGDPRNSGGQARQGAWVNRNPGFQRQDAAPQPQAAPAPAEQHNDGGRNWRRGGDGVVHNRAGQVVGGPAPPSQAPALQNRDEGRRGDGQWNGPRGDRDRGDRNSGDRNWGDHGRDGPRGPDRRWEGDRNWSGRDRPRYDRRYYPPVFHAERRFRGPTYRPPVGFYDRSWVFGDIVPRGWYGSQYYIDDWWTYGLPVPPVGYEWTRIGDDAVLVDTFTGRIVQVVYDLFW
jgi:Ni/Co efflux regulator RcnB